MLRSEVAVLSYNAWQAWRSSPHRRVAEFLPRLHNLQISEERWSKSNSTNHNTSHIPTSTRLGVCERIWTYSEKTQSCNAIPILPIDIRPIPRRDDKTSLRGIPKRNICMPRLRRYPNQTPFYSVSELKIQGPNEHTKAISTARDKKWDRSTQHYFWPEILKAVSLPPIFYDATPKYQLTSHIEIPSREKCWSMHPSNG